MTDPVRELPDPEVDAPSADPGDSDWLERVAFSPEGVDRTLILEQLRRTPTERLAKLEREANRALEMRGWKWPDPD